jgi:hypothetical protein
MSKMNLDNKMFRCICADKYNTSGKMTVEDFKDVSY